MEVAVWRVICSIESLQFQMNITTYWDTHSLSTLFNEECREQIYRGIECICTNVTLPFYSLKGNFSTKAHFLPLDDIGEEVIFQACTPYGVYSRKLMMYEPASQDLQGN